MGKNRKEAVLILHNVRSAYNVGSIFRTADAAGVSRVYLSGYTPAPIDAFGRTRREIAKTALGAEKAVAWEHRASLGPIVSSLRKKGYKLIALEQSRGSVGYKTVSGFHKTALLVGNEVRGLSKSALQKCDIAVEIPMRGVKESLNVSVAAGIALFGILNI